MQRFNLPANPASLTLAFEFHDLAQLFFDTMTVAAHFDQTYEVDENTVSAQDHQAYEPTPLVQVLEDPCPINYVRIPE
jgi:hypothetical protein